MALSLLDVVNLVLKRTRLIQGDRAAITSLTDDQIQTDIDTIIAVINEELRDLYNLGPGLPLPKGVSTTTITLATSTREYSLPTDLAQIMWPLIDTTNGREIFEYPGGFNAMRRDQLQPGNYTGIPIFAAVEPINKKLRVNTTPTAAENGLAYTMHYEKLFGLSSASDTFPMEDDIVRDMVQAFHQRYRSEMKGEFDVGLYNRARSSAVRHLNNSSNKAHY